MIPAQVLLQAEGRAREARSFNALAFTIANETWQIFHYRQALVLRDGVTGADLVSVSGLATLPEDSPFTVWLRRLYRTLKTVSGQVPLFLDLANPQAETEAEGSSKWPAEIDVFPLEGWQEWWSPYLAVVPLVRDDEYLGLALFVFENPLSENERDAFRRLQSVWSYCAWALTRNNRRFLPYRLPKGRNRWIALGAAVVLACFPVRQTALAPAEIVALKAVAVAAPLDGILTTFHVQPNQIVKAGQPLFSLDDTTLRNRREVAARGLEVANAELLSAQQKAFDDLKARADVATLQGRIAERRAELQAVDEQFKRVEVKASRDGIAVFGDINDWQGRPVATGERVMQLADPADAGVLVFLPVADAIALDEGARIRVFLNVSPLSPINSVLSETSYLAVLSPDGIASYRLRGRLENAGSDNPRIGLKGTAKVYGSRVPFVYYLLRRPIAVMRQWSGL